MNRNVSSNLIIKTCLGLLLGLLINFTNPILAFFYDKTDKASVMNHVHLLLEEVDQALEGDVFTDELVDELLHKLRPYILDRFPIHNSGFDSIISRNPIYSKYRNLRSLQEKLVTCLKSLYVKKIELLMQEPDNNIAEAYTYFSLINNMHQINTFGVTQQGREAWELIEDSGYLEEDSNTWEERRIDLRDEENRSLKDTPENIRRLTLIYTDNLKIAQHEAGFDRFLDHTKFNPTDVHVTLVKRKMAAARLALGKLHFNLAKNCFSAVAIKVRAELGAESSPQAFSFDQARNYLEPCLTDSTLSVVDRAQAALYFSNIVHDSSRAMPDLYPAVAERQWAKATRMLKLFKDNPELTADMRAVIKFKLGYSYWQSGNHNDAIFEFLSICQMNDVFEDLRRAAALQMFNLAHQKGFNLANSTVFLMTACDDDIKQAAALPVFGACFNKGNNLPPTARLLRILRGEYDRISAPFYTPIYSIGFTRDSSNRYAAIAANNIMLTSMLMKYYIFYPNLKPADTDIAKELKRCLRMAYEAKTRCALYELLGDHFYINKHDTKQALYNYEIAASLAPTHVFLGYPPYTALSTEGAVRVSKIFEKIVLICKNGLRKDLANLYLKDFISGFFKGLSTQESTVQIPVLLEFLKNPCYQGLDGVNWIATKVVQLYQINNNACSLEDYQRAQQRLGQSESAAHYEQAQKRQKITE